MSTENKNTTEVLTGNSLENFFSGAEPEVKVEQEAEVNLEGFFQESADDFIEKPKVAEIPKEEKQETVKNTFYSDLVKEYLEDGEWQDVDLQIGEGDETITLSEIENITPELFKEIRAAQKQLKEEEFKTDFISIKGLDETKKKMIELAKAGGDVRELVQMEAEFVHPLKGLDLNSEAIQESIVRQKYQSLGWKPKHIDAEIEELKENLQLDLEAKKVIEEVDTNFDKLVESKKEEQLSQLQAIKDEQKDFRKKMTETFRGLELKDVIVKNLVEATSKFDENGIAEVDKAFFAAKANPELFAKVAFLLTDENAFNEFQGVKIKNNETKKAIKTILKITPRTNTSSAVPQKQDKLQEFFQQT